MIKLKPILPKRPFIDARKVQRAIDDGMQEAADLIVKDFQSTTDTWKHRVEFTIKKQKDGFLIGTKDDVWNMLDHGTKAHDISPRNGKVLRFQGGPYRPKTRPGYIGSQSGGPSGPVVFRPKVHHPGTAPRGWSKLVRKKWQSRLAQIVQKHINAAVR